ncbi:MAG: site-specific DNA-methyltransferase [Candidatus Heimdallarchaeota archaeon]|nr:site-specific DNA-methyltransferase [Candidatus Heimdallarchaeota archaeon]
MNPHFKKNLILVGSYIDTLDNIPLNEGNRPNLIILDISSDFLKIGTKVNPKNKKDGYEEIEKKLNFLDKDDRFEYFERIKLLSSKILSILDNKGFFAIKINGTIKHLIKTKIDEVFSVNKFVNEIIINSPFIITSAPPNNVIEQTEYILLYCKANSPKIKPVFNDKPSGGYWHSFISKGQGSEKNFLFNDQIVRLRPPVGTHWKLKQDSILELCREGKIRLNKNRNPEYWVPKKEGRIIDSNWLDLNLFQKDSNGYFFDSGIFTRLFKSLVSSNDIILEINSENASNLIKAVKLDLQWICLISSSDALENIVSTLEKQNIKPTVKYIQENRKESRILQSTKLEKSFHSEIVQKEDSKFDLVHKCTYLKKEKVDQWSNELIHGDCIHILRLLQDRNDKSIKLIYIDPPFFTGIDEIIHIPLRGKSDTDGTSEISRSVDSVAYKNVLQGETQVEDFKSWFKTRLSLMRPLLRLDGFIFVRFDYHFGHYAKIVLDEVFEPENFVIEFLIRRMKKNLSQKQLNKQTHLIVHSDSLFVYRASEQAILNMNTVKKKKRQSQDFVEIEFSNDNVWLDIAGYQKVKRTLYPTENAETLLQRIIEVSTSPRDLVADFFAGSGTTLAVAEKLGRKWIGADIGSQSVHEIRKRLLQFPKRMAIDYYKLNKQILHQNSENIHLLADSSQVDIITSIKENEVTVSIQDYVNKTQMSELIETYSYDDLIDYWEIDWNYNGSVAIITWYSKRLLEKKVVLSSVDTFARHNYTSSGSYKIFVNVIDIFGNCIQSIFKIQI